MDTKKQMSILIATNVICFICIAVLGFYSYQQNKQIMAFQKDLENINTIDVDKRFESVSYRMDDNESDINSVEARVVSLEDELSLLQDQIDALTFGYPYYR